MKRIFATTAVLFAFASVASAQTATTDPVGFVSVTVPAQSDAVLAVPLNRSAAFKGKIQTISSNVITVAGTPAWTANQFVQAIPTQNDTFAIQIATGTKEGLIAKVTANGTNTLTVQFDAGDDLTGVKSVDVDGVLNADEIDVMPYWTPSSLFTAAVPNDSEIFLYSSTIPGVNLAPAKLYLMDGGAWLDQDTFEAADSAALPFGVAFIFRNHAASPVVASFVGSVPMSKHRFLIRTLANNQDQDIRIGYTSPVPEVIGSLAFGFSNDDQLFVYNNAATGFNKAPAKILLFDGSAWIDTDDFSDVTNSFALQPGQGYVFRRKSTPTPQMVVWSDLQSYLAP